jgi:hypothetical protein
MAIAPASAGLFAEQDMQIDTSVRRVTIRVQDGKVRLDLGNGSSVIVDPQKDRVVTLFHHDAFAVVEHGREAMLKAIRPAQTNYAAPRGAPEMSTEKFAGYECRVSNWEWDVYRNAIWVAPGYPDHEKFEEYRPTLQACHCYCLPLLGGGGMALKTVTGSTGDLLTTTLVSARTENIPANVFEIPPGFRKDRP